MLNMNDRSPTAPPERNAAWIWQQIRREAAELGAAEPVLASFFHSSLLSHDSLAAALSFLLASQLGDRDVGPMLLREVCEAIYRDEPELLEMAAADICAHYDRDPACTRYSMPLLHFKGFQAIQSQRFAHALWRRERRTLALFIQNRCATRFDVDIHPAARIGRGVMVDHATAVVIGETAVIGDNVSMLHSVSLGGSGRSTGLRHPQVGEGVLIAAGARLFGAVTIGSGAKVAAGSVVIDDVPAHTTVAGVPARPVGTVSIDQPALLMDQGIDAS
jgi:serine O-acetyltransferase